MSCRLPALLSLCLTACAGTAPLPPRAVELNQLGASALQQGDLETAGARLNLALEYNPEFVEALTNLGLVELRRGNFDRAEQLLNRSQRLNPDIAQTHHGLGVLAEHRHRRGEASDFYREALAVDPGFAEARSNLARLLFEDGLYEHAMVEFKLLAEAAPQRLEGHFGLASSLLALDRLKEASDVAATMRKQFGETPDLRLLEGRVLVATGHCPQALAELAPLAKSESTFTATALSWMGVCELALGRPARAVGATEQALNLEPEHPLATYVLAIALSDLNDSSAPLWRQRALKLNPNHPELLKRRAAPAKQHGAPAKQHGAPANRQRR